MGGTDQTWAWLLDKVAESGLISETEKQMLTVLPKRDERHGKASANVPCYARGPSSTPKVAMQSRTYGRVNFRINSDAKGGAVMVDRGELLSDEEFEGHQ